MSDSKQYAKSISRFPRLSSDSLYGEELFLISQASSGSYGTYNTTLNDIIDYSINDLSNSIEKQWNLDKVNVGNLNTTVNNFLNNDKHVLTVKSNVKFKQIPTILAESTVSGLTDNSVVTKKNVLSLITTSESFIGPDSKIEARPNNCSESGATSDVDREKMMIFKIPQNGNDSSKFIKDGETIPVGSIKCKKTGHLVVYGWLADKGNVLPQEAWVALCGKIKNGVDATGTWTILQVQPWNVSDRSHIIQYVGFNVPVCKDLELKIRCGFTVDDSATATNDYNTLTFDQVEPNTFVGYIID